MSMHFSLNGSPVSLREDTKDSAIEVLRRSFACLETMWGCDVGLCSSCQIVVNGKPARSCQMDATELRGKEVITAAFLSEAWFEWMTKYVQRNTYCAICLPGRLLVKLHENEGETWMKASTITSEMDSFARSYLGIPHCQCGEYRPMKWRAGHSTATRTGATTR